MNDVIIIGAGITGCLIALELAKYDLKIKVIEKHNDVACEASKANSAIVHSGHDPKPNTLKARFNLEGSKLYPSLCHHLHTNYKQCGALVVATNDDELKVLDNIINQTISRGIPYEILDTDGLRKIEPNISDNCIKGLSLPSTAIITPWEVCIAAMEESILNGVELLLNHEVTAISTNLDHFVVHSNNESFKTKIVINCAGVFADEITQMIHPSPYYITARKGEYFVLDHSDNPVVKHVIYPTPTINGKGVLVVPTIDNNILLGPNSQPINDKNDNSTTNDLDYVMKNVHKTVKNIPLNTIIRNFAGLRPSGDTKDFIIEEDKQFPNFIHVACIESPGLASAPAIAKYVVNILLENKLSFNLKPNYINRTAMLNPKHLSQEEYQALIASNATYGNIICRCEQISEGEIIDAIHRACGATSVNGVKRRCRPGMGKCQGGFCEPNVVKILSRELNLSIKDIIFEEINSNIVDSYAKENSYE